MMCAPRRAIYVQLCLWLTIVTGCAAATSPATPLNSTWGTVTTFGQADQREAPTFLQDEHRFIATWIGSDDSSVYHTAWLAEEDKPLIQMQLQLAVVRAYNQRLIPSISENSHLLWMDKHESGETRLYAALLSPGLETLRGPTLISDQKTYHYAVVPTSDGALWTVWSGGLTVEPRLYAQYIDAQGRPRFPQALVSDAHWPTLLWDNSGMLHLFWRRVSDGSIYHALLGDGVLSQSQRFVEGVNLSSGDRLEGISAGLDNTYGYVFWNIARAEGHRETWFASGLLSSEQWFSPVQLGIAVTSKRQLETGFNGGLAQGALSGQDWLTWAAPLDTQSNALPIAAVDESGLVVVYLQNGSVVGYQTIISLDLPLIGAPLLMTDRDRHLYLLWAEPTSEGSANLRMTSTRPLNIN